MLFIDFKKHILLNIKSYPIKYFKMKKHQNNNIYKNELLMYKKDIWNRNCTEDAMNKTFILVYIYGPILKFHCKINWESFSLIDFINIAQ